MLLLLSLVPCYTFSYDMVEVDRAAQTILGAQEKIVSAPPKRKVFYRAFGGPLKSGDRGKLPLPPSEFPCKRKTGFQN